MDGLLFVISLILCVQSDAIQCFSKRGGESNESLEITESDFRDFSKIESIACNGRGSVTIRKCGVVPKVRFRRSPHETAFGELPWQVAIIDKLSERFLCGGVLLSYTTVLTVKYCIENSNLENIVVRLGDWDIRNEHNPEEIYRSLEFQVTRKAFRKVARLRDFDTGIPSSIVYLELKHIIHFESYPHIAPVCSSLYSEEDAMEPMLQCLVSGWEKSGRITVIQDYFNEFPSYAMPMECKNDTCMKYGEEGIRVELMKNSQLNKQEIIEDQGISRVTPYISQILNKAAVKISFGNDCGSNIKRNEFCALPVGDSLPCKADIGSPVICKIHVAVNMSDKARDDAYNTFLRKLKNNPGKVMTTSQWEVIGLVTQTYNCSQGDNISKPLIVESLDQFLTILCS